MSHLIYLSLCFILNRIRREINKVPSRKSFTVISHHIPCLNTLTTINGIKD
jgi:hypothetical protein